MEEQITFSEPRPHIPGFNPYEIINYNLFVANLRSRCREFTLATPAPVLREAATDTEYALPFLPTIPKHFDYPDIPDAQEFAFSHYQ